MVFRGRPSRGCEGCRKAGIKCDEQRPSCHRCRRLLKACAGYRKHDELLVLDETAKTESKCLLRHKSIDTRLVQQQIDFPLDSSGGDRAVWRFYFTTIATLSKEDHSYHLHMELPTMYSKSHIHSALYLSTQAIAHASALKSGTSTTTKARLSYARAVEALCRAIEQPTEAAADETLYAALLLSGYETTTDSEKTEGWAAHVRGTAALLAYRGKQSIKGPLSTRMLYFARRSIILYQVQASTLVAPRYDPPETISSREENESDRLFTLMARLSELQHYLKAMPVPSLNETEQICKLLAESRTLDRDFLEWQNTLPDARSFTTKCRLNNHCSASINEPYVLFKVHTYPDTYTARLWNIYRTSLVVLYFVTLRLKEMNEDLDASLCDSAVANILDETRIKHLIDDICASVPFLSRAHLTTSESTAPRNAYISTLNSDLLGAKAKSTGIKHGQYSLLWPLYVALGVPFIPELQRAWMRQQLLLMAESGELLAARLADSPCQILNGGMETHVFECV